MTTEQHSCVVVLWLDRKVAWDTINCGALCAKQPTTHTPMPDTDTTDTAEAEAILNGPDVKDVITALVDQVQELKAQLEAWSNATGDETPEDLEARSEALRKDFDEKMEAVKEAMQALNEANAALNEALNDLSSVLED